MHSRTTGFTLVELVVALVVAGILAAVAIPRFVGRDAFDSRGFSDRFVSTMQFARQQAIAQRRLVCVAVDVRSVTITQALAPPEAAGGSACAGPLTNPTTGAAYTISDTQPAGQQLPTGVSIVGVGVTLPVTLTFTALGQPSMGATFRVNGDVARCITIEAVTGYIHVTC